MDILQFHNLKVKLMFSFLLLGFIAFMLFGTRNIDTDSIEKDLAMEIESLKYEQEFNQFKRAQLQTQDSNVLGLQNNTELSSIPVLVYHNIGETEDGVTITVEKFKEQMFMLKQYGYETIGIEDFHDYVKGKKHITNKIIYITFDDGAKTSYYPTDPILKTVGYKATNFIITKYSVNENNAYYLDASEIKEMIASGRWDIQAHTKNGHEEIQKDEKGDKGYFYSNKMWLADQKRKETLEEYNDRIYTDFYETKEDIKNTFGISSIGFAFPFGDFGIYENSAAGSREHILKNVKQIYDLAFYQFWEDSEFSFSQNYPNPDTFLVKRIEIRPEWNGEDLISYLEKGQSKALPYLDELDKDQGWVNTWGEKEIVNGQLILASDAKTNGASVYLDGTYKWQNYTSSAYLELEKGTNVTAIAGYKDRDNYYTCDFGVGFVSIRTKLKGKVIKLTEVPHTLPIDIISIEVKNNTIGCWLNGVKIVELPGLDPQSLKGGIAFQVWDSRTNNSKAVIERIKVTGSN